MSFNKNDSGFILRWSKKIKAIELLGGKCLKCHTDNIFVLGFHHISDDKDGDVTHFLGSRWSKLEKEIQKCQLLCRNCHMEMHNNSKDIRLSELKNDLLRYKGVSGCQSCGYAGDKKSSLDFHHRISSEKQFRITHELTKKRDGTIARILKEVDKCDVLCGNCHLLKHQEVDRFNRLKDKIYSKVKSYKELSLPIDIGLVLNMYKSGLRQFEIVKKLKCLKSTVSKVLKDNL